MPEEDATGFYRRCGLRPEREIRTYRIAVQPGELPANWNRIRRIPKKLIRSLPMGLGAAQASSAHMWEMCNRPIVVAGEPERHPCAARNDGQAYVQLRHLGQGHSTLVLNWAAASVSGTEVLSVAHAIGSRMGLAEISLMGYGKEMARYGNMGRCENTTRAWSVRIF